MAENDRTPQAIENIKGTLKELDKLIEADKDPARIIEMKALKDKLVKALEDIQLSSSPK
ncbi:MAG TPA: hypothetical protein VGI82_10000 [Chitinophagaceae bacterium]